jgi:hypothetical protein
LNVIAVVPKWSKLRCLAWELYIFVQTAPIGTPYAIVARIHIMTPKLKTFVISALRQATFKWKPRQIAYNAAKEQTGEFKTGRPKYSWRCARCEGLFKSKEIVVDHIDPVVPLDGYKSGMEFDLNEYVVRMFCAASGFSVLCGPCHDEKTKKENKIREDNKRKKKVADLKKSNKK